MKKILALVLAVAMVLSMAACGTQPAGNTTGSTEPSAPALQIETFEGDFVYKDSVSVLSANWNPHTYQGADQSYPLDYTTSSLYSFFYNDELNAVEGKAAYEGYVIVPDMAASMAVDVTEKVKAEHPEFGIPESATSGFAYTIDLNTNLTWDDGTPITAETYVESMKRLLDPKLMNYRAEDVYTGDLVIAGAKAYANQGKSIFKPLGMKVSDYLANGGKAEDLYVNMEFWGVNAANGTKYGSVTDDTMVRDPSVAEGEPEDYVSAKYLFDTYLGAGCPYEAYSSEYVGTMIVEFPDAKDFSTVGLYASGDYQLTLVLENALSGFYFYYSVGILDLALVKIDLYDACLKETEASFILWRPCP